MAPGSNYPTIKKGDYMQMLPKKMLIPMAAVALIGAGVYGAAHVSAASDTSNPQSSLVQKLADTFHVDKAKVQAVFDEDRAAHHAEGEKTYEARLTQAVKDGKLTNAQKDLVLAEHKKLAAEMEALMKDDTSKADHRAAMEKIHTEGETWAKANNIDAKWLMGGGPGLHVHFEKGDKGPMMGHGFGMGHGPGMGFRTSDEAPATSPSE